MSLYANGHKIAPIIKLVPTGTKNITENGTYDVTNDATANVNVPQGWTATIEVTTTAGTTVTVDGKSQVATYGYATFTVYSSGSYTITGTLNGHTNTTSVYVYSAEYYTATLYMTATIRVNAPVNTVVTIGSESQTVTGTYVDFTVYSTGTYTVTGTLNGLTTTNTVTVSSMGNTYSTTLVFGCYINIHSNNGTDVIYNGLRQTVGDTGYVRFWITGTGTYKFLCIYKGQSKTRDIVVTSTATDIDENICFVPSAYSELEYLESTGTQYIDTGVIPVLGTSMEAKIKFSNLSQGRNGTYGNHQDGCRFYFGTTSNKWCVGWGSSAENGYDHNLGTSDTNEHIFYMDNSKFAIDGVTKKTYSRAWVSTIGTIGVGGAIQETYLNWAMSGRIYYLKIKNNENIARNLIPCKRKSDSVLGMYDLVNDVFYTNAGTGSFIAGPMANLPAEYQEVEYLQSSGTQYIDTGVTSSSVTSCIMKSKFVITEAITDANSYGLWGQINRNAVTVANDIYGNVVTNTGFYTYSFTSSSSQIGFFTTPINTITDIEVSYIDNVSKVILNRDQKTYNNTSATKMFTNNFYVFKINDTLIERSVKCKIYSFSLEINGILTRNLVPCYRKSDSVLGMYDLVNGVFYENAGTGEFTAGNPVGTDFSLPSEYTYVKYVASTSAKTQYLNLGETGTNTTGMLIKVYDENNAISKDDIYVGARAVSNGRYLIGGTNPAGMGDFTYFGWNTLNRLSTYYGYPEDINATKALRTFYMNYLNNRQEGFDNTKAFDIDQTLVQTTPNIYAFCEDNIGTGLYPSWCRLYYAVLTSGTSISNIFIPCYRNSDNVIGMYDIVKGNFKTNAGSGSFVYEADS